MVVKLAVSEGRTAVALGNVASFFVFIITIIKNIIIIIIINNIVTINIIIFITVCENDLIVSSFATFVQLTFFAVVNFNWKPKLSLLLVFEIYFVEPLRVQRYKSFTAFPHFEEKSSLVFYKIIVLIKNREALCSTLLRFLTIMISNGNTTKQ